MPHIVTDPCVGCRNTVCVTVCPVDCFHRGEDALWIDPDECIDCGACIPECPVDAIYDVSKMPEKWNDYIQLNAEKAKIYPVIVDQLEPLSDDPQCQGHK